MKRIVAVLTVLSLICLPVSAQSAFTYVTDFEYALIRDGGVNGTFVYGAYEDNGQSYVMGTLTADGEQSRTAWSAEGWSALFAPTRWSVTVHGDAGTLCPYADTHRDVTLCPYQDVSLVTLTDTQTGAVLERYYMYDPQKHVMTGSSLHLCWGRYGYVSPETLKWNGNSTRVALCDENGKWGVYDTATQTMLTAYIYEDMSAVYGDYVKVSDGNAWGRLDLNGATDIVYGYAAQADFSITEELRVIADGKWQVFNADNEPISAVYEPGTDDLSYAPEAHMLFTCAEDGTKALLDLQGKTVATFTDSQTVTYLDGVCYAVGEQDDSGAVLGVALACANNIPQPEDTVTKGDVNFDGEVNTSDVWLVLRSTVELTHLTSRQQLAADVTADGAVDSADVRALLRQIVE